MDADSADVREMDIPVIREAVIGAISALDELVRAERRAKVKNSALKNAKSNAEFHEGIAQEHRKECDAALQEFLKILEISG